MFEIFEPTSPEHFNEVRRLWAEYWDWLEFEPCFQDFDRELKTLPGEYAAPNGCILVASMAGVVAGCVAVRRLEGDVCEMKRLYVPAEFRGKHIGFRLASAIVVEARRLGYVSMRLDTLPSMEKAISIYKRIGFEEIGPYVNEPIPEAKYMELRL